MTLDMRAPSMRLKLTDDETAIDLAALQGLWSVEHYLKLTNQTKRHTCYPRSNSVLYLAA
ncbi:MAG: hypothetical protein MI924_32015 [Chloroflexales bacterium]|nr:hypothetical protein [Chloroflexales bacterium]